MATDNTLYDLTDDQYRDYENDPDKYQDVTSNTEEDSLSMMFPDRESNDEYDDLG